MSSRESNEDSPNDNPANIRLVCTARIPPSDGPIRADAPAASTWRTFGRLAIRRHQLAHGQRGCPTIEISPTLTSFRIGIPTPSRWTARILRGFHTTWLRPTDTPTFPLNTAASSSGFFRTGAAPTRAAHRAEGLEPTHRRGRLHHQRLIRLVVVAS